MTVNEVMAELEAMGSEQTKKVLKRHGATEPFFGVKVGDLKKILKKSGTDHALALELYATGNSDAMYLAGLMADAQRIRVEDLEDWVRKANWYMLSEYTVAWLAADSPHGMHLGLRWIESDNEGIASAGWSTLSNVVSVLPDEQLDLSLIKGLLDRIERSIQGAPNRVRYTMNGFVIAVGSYITTLQQGALDCAARMGKVEVFVGETDCKVPPAAAYIKKVMDAKRTGKKRKMARC